MNWISVKERLPEENVKVLLYTDSGIFEGYYETRNYTVDVWTTEPRTITTKKGTTYTREQCVIRPEKRTFSDFQTNVNFITSCCGDYDVEFTTYYWMPMPELPKDKQ